MNEIGFGIGCFHFELPAAGLDIEKWACEVKRALEIIPSIRAVEVETSTTRSMFSGEDGFYFSPHPSDAQVGFRITIPRRIQEEVAPWLGPRDAHSEDFAVVTYYQQEFPVTFVTEIGPHASTDVSHGVAIVRDFLVRELGRLGEEAGGVRLVFIGPSPFHVHLKLVPDSGEASSNDSLESVGMSYARTPQPGYPSVVVRYDQARFQSEAEAIDGLVRLVVDQLGYFYYLIRLRIRRMDQMDGVRHEINELIAMHQASGVKGWWRRVFWSGKLARELSLTTISLGFRYREEVRSSREQFDRLYESTKLPVFRSWLESETTDDYGDELSNCREVAELLEPRRLREVNTVLILVVAAVSAALGAIANHLLG